MELQAVIYDSLNQGGAITVSPPGYAYGTVVVCCDLLVLEYSLYGVSAAKRDQIVKKIFFKNNEYSGSNDQIYL